MYVMLCSTEGNDRILKTFVPGRRTSSLILKLGISILFVSTVCILMEVQRPLSRILIPSSSSIRSAKNDTRSYIDKDGILRHESNAKLLRSNFPSSGFVVLSLPSISGPYQQRIDLHMRE